MYFGVIVNRQNYSSLKTKVQQAEAGGFLRYLRPDFLDELAENTALDEL
jgi:hypothetical protein